VATVIEPRRRGLALNINLLDIMLFTQMFLLALYYSGSYYFFEQYRSALFQGIFAIDALFIVAALPFTPVVALSSALIILIVVGYQAVFTFNYGTAFTGAYIGSFPCLYAAGLFALHARRRTLARALGIIYAASLLYLFVYLYLRHSIDPYTIMKQQLAGGEGVSRAVARAHGSAGAASGQTEYRIRISGFHQAFVLFYSIALLRVRRGTLPRVGWTLSALFAGYCLAVADYRFNLACVGLAVLIGLLPAVRVTAKAASALAIALISVVVTTVCGFTSLNPFTLFAGDETGMFRANEFAPAMQQFRRFPVFGIGLPGSSDDYTTAFEGTQVFPSDLGYFGELLQHGVIGMMLLFVSHVLVFLLIVRATRRFGPGVESRVILDCFVFTVLTEFVVTSMWEAASGLLVSLAIAYGPVLAQARLLIGSERRALAVPEEVSAQSAT
jgi:hypothetical protein